MLEQVSNALTFLAFYTASKQGKTGLTVTVDVRRDTSTLVTAGSATEIGGGLYYYTLASGSNTAEGLYTAVFKTTDTTVDMQWIPALWAVQKAGIEDLDATISSRSSHSAADVWAVATRTLTAFSFAVDLSTAATQAVWDKLTSALTTAGSIGKLLVDNVNATISSRLASSGYTAPDNTSVSAIKTQTDKLNFTGTDVKATLDGETVTVATNNDKTGYSLSSAGVQAIWDALTSALTTVGSIGKLLVDNINATISSRAPSSTALTNATWTDARAAKLDDLDATISSRLASSGYTAPPTAAAIADQVWDETASDHTSAGSTGAKLGLEASAATIAAAVWDETASSHATTGTTGAKLNQIGTASVTVVSPVAESGDVEIQQGDDYLIVDDRALEWTLTGAPDLSGATITFKGAGLEKEGDASGAVVTVELTAAETAEMTAGVLPYEVEAELGSGSIVSLVRGKLTIVGNF